MKGENYDGNLEGAAVFAAGFVEGWLTAFAHETSNSQVLLTHRVVDILHTGRSDRPKDHLRALRVPATRASQRVPEMAEPRGPRGGGASGEGPRRRRRMSPEARRRISEMMKKRWAERKRRHMGKSGKLRNVA